MAETSTTTADRRLAAILAADVVGYSRLMGADETGTLRRVQAMIAEVARPTVTGRQGRIFKLNGDAFLAEFPSAVSAVLCAAEIQAAMRAAEAGQPEPLALRIGVHLGDVVPQGDDLFGDGVNIAARLEGVAEPGGVALSADVANAVRGKVPFGLVDAGPQALKNIARPVGVFRLSGEGAPPRGARRRRWPVAAATMLLALGGLGAAWWAWRPAAIQAPVVAGPAPAVQVGVPRLSFVVLPFANRSGDSEQDYFVDGLTDSLTTDLSRLDGSFVISRGSAFTYKGRAVDARQVGRELGVRYVIEGSVLRSGDRVRVTAQLVEAESGRTLWSDSFDGSRGDMLEMVDSATARIAAAVGVQAIEDESRRRRRQDNSDAADMALRGWAMFYRGVTDSARLAEAAPHFEAALAMQPDLISALNGLAWVFAQQLGLETSPQTSSLGRQSEVLTEKVLRQDPDNATAHLARCRVLSLTDRARLAVSSCERALSKSPNWAFAYYILQGAYLRTGRHVDGLEAINRAIRLSPRDQAIGVMYFMRGVEFYLTGRYDEASEILDASEDRNKYFALTYRAAAYAMLGWQEAAEATVRELLRQLPHWTIAVEQARAIAQSSDPQYLRERQRYVDGLRRAGLPEE